MLIQLSLFIRIAALLLVSFLLISGCTTLQPSPDQLQQRAETYWKARVDGDLIAAFEFEELRARGKQTLQQYARLSPPLIIKAKVTGVRLETQDKGVVTVETEVRLPALLTGKTLPHTFGDQWVAIEGKWYHVHLPALPSPNTQ